MNANKEEETRGKYRENVVGKKEMTNTLQKARKRKWRNQERMMKERNEGEHRKPI
jgi:hypothetical protein